MFPSCCYTLFPLSARAQHARVHALASQRLRVLNAAHRQRAHTHTHTHEIVFLSRLIGYLCCFYSSLYVACFCDERGRILRQQKGPPPQTGLRLCYILYFCEKACEGCVCRWLNGQTTNARGREKGGVSVWDTTEARTANRKEGSKKGTNDGGGGGGGGHKRAPEAAP